MRVWAVLTYRANPSADLKDDEQLISVSVYCCSVAIFNAIDAPPLPSTATTAVVVVVRVAVVAEQQE